MAVGAAQVDGTLASGEEVAIADHAIDVELLEERNLAAAAAHVSLGQRRHQRRRGGAAVRRGQHRVGLGRGVENRVDDFEVDQPGAALDRRDHALGVEQVERLARSGLIQAYAAAGRQFAAGGGLEGRGALWAGFALGERDRGLKQGGGGDAVAGDIEGRRIGIVHEPAEAGDHDLAAVGEAQDQVVAVDRDLGEGGIEIDDEALAEAGLDDDDLARLGRDQPEGVFHARDDALGLEQRDDVLAGVLEAGAVLQLRQVDQVLEDDLGAVLEHQDQVVALDERARLGGIEVEHIGLARLGRDLHGFARRRPADQDAGLADQLLGALGTGHALALDARVLGVAPGEIFGHRRILLDGSTTAA